MRGGLRRGWSSSGIVLASLLVASGATAEPQISTGLTGGVSARDLGAPEIGGHLGVRGDVLLFRDRDSDMGVGPFVALLTQNFRSVEVGGGGTWLVPLVPLLPAEVSVGGFASRTDRWAPGVMTRLFIGSRSHNFHGAYGLAAGGFVEARATVGDAPQTDLLLGAQIDLLLLALPFMALGRLVAR